MSDHEIRGNDDPPADRLLRPSRQEEELAFPNFLKPVEVTLELTDVDPAVLGLLFGDLPAEPPTVSIEMWTPVKRTFWQWLLRRPRQHTLTLIPAANITTDPT